VSFFNRGLRTLKGEQRHRTDAELNLIPLIDILSVLVAFLLVYSTEVEVVQNTKGIEIPQSTADVQPKQSVLVMVTKDQLFVQGEQVASIQEIRDSDSPLIEPLRQVLDRPMLEGHAESKSAVLAKREITVLADKSLTYDVFKKVMATCTAASYGKVSLAVVEKEAPAHAGLNAI
jgi:biopolymer transport protein ExbD